MEELLNKIHSTGYWRVQIRPTHFDESRIKTLKECWEAVESSSVYLRGWDYPHVDSENRENGLNYVASGVDFGSSKEYWRLYQSGMFIHHFSCMEDYEISSTNVAHYSIRTPSPSGKYLGIITTLYTLTEVFLFASRLAAKQILDPACEITIHLHGMKDRQLMFFDRVKHLRAGYICKISDLPISQTYTIADITANHAENAREIHAWIIERFQCDSFTANSFQEEQLKFIERKL